MGHTLEVVEIHHPRAADSRPTLVFLHEGLGCIELWRDVPARIAIATGCDAVIYDRLGYGRSDPLPYSRQPADYLHEQAWRYLPALMDSLDLNDIIPIGHSDGGSIALLFAAQFPRQTAAAVTEAAHVFVEDITLGGIRTAVTAYRETNLRAKLMTYHGDKTDRTFFAWANAWLSPEFRNWNIEDYLAHIRSPLLILQGTGDDYGSPAQVEAIRRQAGGNAQAELIEGCGHTPHLQARRDVIAMITGFVERCMRERTQTG